MKNAASITIARCLAVIWAVFWIWFGVASSLSQRGGGLAGLVHLLPWAIWAIASIVIVWRRLVEGGGLLVVEGLALSVLVMTYMSPANRPFLFPILALPPVVAGLLFLRAGLHRGV